MYYTFPFWNSDEMKPSQIRKLLILNFESPLKEGQRDEPLVERHRFQKSKR